MHDAVIVGAGPNGLSAAIVLARAGLSTLVLEANETIGGGARSEQVTLPGFIHDICSAIHPMSMVSPFIQTPPPAGAGRGCGWSPPETPHPPDAGGAGTLEQSPAATGGSLDEDGRAYRKL